MDAQTLAAILSKLDHAKMHMEVMADRTAPHWAWVEANDEQFVLFREYPLHGIRIRQCDVTVWKH